MKNIKWIDFSRGQAYPGNDSAIYRSSQISSAPTPAFSTLPRNTPISYYQPSTNQAIYDHANAKIYDPADPLAVNFLVCQKLIYLILLKYLVTG